MGGVWGGGGGGRAHLQASKSHKMKIMKVTAEKVRKNPISSIKLHRADRRDGAAVVGALWGAGVVVFDMFEARPRSPGAAGLQGRQSAGGPVDIGLAI